MEPELLRCLQWPQRARRPKTPAVRARTCVACRLTQPPETLVRYGASADGAVRAGAVGGRGAWICQSGDEAHDLLIGEGLRRGLKGRIAATDLEQILIERRSRRDERG
ncbi:MAG: DUF448 domain-containing protein [Chloroflexi bacterium]|nr:DUF448 domain-containing protein [Chloroflexota bacterium]